MPQVGLRLPRELIAKADALAVRLRQVNDAAALPASSFNRALVLRHAIERGMAAIAADLDKKHGSTPARSSSSAARARRAVQKGGDIR
jgi:hypothetical protein